MFDANNFTAIAKRITPNIFLIILIPFLPISLSIFEEVLRIRYKKIIFMIIATTIFIVANSALNESIVVKLPGPAINGNANGNTDAVTELESSSL